MNKELTVQGDNDDNQRTNVRQQRNKILFLPAQLIQYKGIF